MLWNEVDIVELEIMNIFPCFYFPPFQKEKAVEYFVDGTAV